MSPAAQKPSDFVQVQLTVAAAKVAPVRVSTAHFSYEFVAGKGVRVLTSEWSRMLSKQMFQGSPLLEATPEEQPAKQAAPAPAIVATPTTQKGTSDGRTV